MFQSKISSLLNRDIIPGDLATGAVSLFRFLLRVLRGFMRNQGLILSSAIAYNTLLSIVPLSILALVVLTRFMEEQQLILTLSMYLEMLIPGYSATLTEQVLSFLQHRRVISVIGLLGMLFFGSMAFSILESAMAVIFSRQVRVRHRTLLVSAVIPYLYIAAMAVGILLVSYIVGRIGILESGPLTLFGRDLQPGGVTRMALYTLGIAGEALMFSSIYLVMPVAKVRRGHAVIGGIVATVLWEITRRVLIWYYATVTMVNVIYGSITITVVALICIDVVAIILLLGAQVIAELEQSRAEAAGGTTTSA